MGEPGEEREVLLQFVERFALVLRESGMSPMPARVFAYALADDADRYTAAELAEGLGVSLAAISGAVRQLVQIGLLSREREPGTRSDLYVLDDRDLWSRFYTARTGLLEVYERTMADGVAVLGADQPGGRRLEESREFFAFLLAEIPPMLERWRAHRQRLYGDQRG
ncbi:MAG TPA: MarR family transcriptional regulator [Jiangellales bacterium]|nr:MarR family transcriptional regulator [Jiangellales bacterium]